MSANAVSLFVQRAIIRPSFLWMIFLSSMNEGRCADDITREIEANFMGFVEKVDQNDISWIDQLHPRSIRIFRDILTSHLNKKIKTNAEYINVTGLPKDFARLTDREFIITVVRAFISAHPKELAFPKWANIRIVGILKDGDDSVLVYRVPGPYVGLSDPATICFSMDGNQLKISSVLFVRILIIKWENQWLKKSEDVETNDK